jgi:hypothetical protein
MGESSGAGQRPRAARRRVLPARTEEAVPSRNDVEERATQQRTLRTRATATAVTAAGFLGLVAVLLPSSSAVASASAATSARAVTSQAVSTSAVVSTSRRASSLTAPFGSRQISDTQTSGQ